MRLWFQRNKVGLLRSNIVPDIILLILLALKTGLVMFRQRLIIPSKRF